ncbi:MAG: hypothetical protein H7222_11765 [Methylotenera sp.]|nr:hypothetical protein [Oligoflexia bacterium]
MMNKTHITRTRSLFLERFTGFFLLSLCTFCGASALTACSSAPHRSVELAETKSAVAPISEIEISYNRGHDAHRFVLSEKEGQVLATSFLDHELVKSKKISPDKYHEFKSHMAEFVALECKTARLPAASAPLCRSHYSISMRSGDEVKQKSGCRVSDDQGSKLGQLLLEADFLIAGKAN